MKTINLYRFPKLYNPAKVGISPKKDTYLRRTIIIIVFIILMIGCATPYQHRGWRGGYSHLQLDNNVFRVRFSGNGYTSMSRAIDFNLLRSAEITLRRGYKYFQVVNSRSGHSYSSHRTPERAETSFYGNSATTTITGGETYHIAKPSTSHIIVCFKQRPKNGLSYNAKLIYKTLKRRYGL